jgi:hypothetical protein
MVLWSTAKGFTLRENEKSPKVRLTLLVNC